MAKIRLIWVLIVWLDGLIFMAIAMVLVRTVGLGVRASRLSTAALAQQSC